MSSAYADTFCWVPPTSIPITSGFRRIVHRKGSSDRAKRRGDRGQPCRVLFVILKGSDRTPLALTQGSE